MILYVKIQEGSSMQEDIFLINGIKRTENRKIIVDTLSRSHEPMTAEMIYLEIRNDRNINLSTVYRILSIMTDKGIVCKSMGADGKAYFCIHGNEHNHYLTCVRCNRKIPIDGCPLEQMGKDLVEKTGFRITGHNLEFLGECPECVEKKKE